MDVLDRCLPSTIQAQFDGAVLLSRNLGWRGTEFVKKSAKMLLLVGRLRPRGVSVNLAWTNARTDQDVPMLQQQGMGIVQLVKSDLNHEIFLRQGHILVHLDRYQAMATANFKVITNLKSVIKVANLAEIVEKKVDASFVILHKRIQRGHVLFLGVRWLVRQILQHFRDLEGRRHSNRTYKDCLQVSVSGEGALLVLHPRACTLAG